MSESAEALLRKKAMESMLRKKSDTEARPTETEVKRPAELDDKEDGEVEDEAPSESVAKPTPSHSALVNVNNNVLDFKPRTVNLNRTARPDGGQSNLSMNEENAQQVIVQTDNFIRAQIISMPILLHCLFGAFKLNPGFSNFRPGQQHRWLKLREHRLELESVT
jgi:hypothetical protein